MSVQCALKVYSNIMNLLGVFAIMLGWFVAVGYARKGSKSLGDFKSIPGGDVGSIGPTEIMLGSSNEYELSFQCPATLVPPPDILSLSLDGDCFTANVLAVNFPTDQNFTQSNSLQINCASTGMLTLWSDPENCSGTKLLESSIMCYTDVGKLTLT